jgi:hypothetical protein
MANKKAQIIALFSYLNVLRILVFRRYFLEIDRVESDNFQIGFADGAGYHVADNRLIVNNYV